MSDESLPQEGTEAATRRDRHGKEKTPEQLEKERLARIRKALKDPRQARAFELRCQGGSWRAIANAVKTTEKPFNFKEAYPDYSHTQARRDFKEEAERLREAFTESNEEFRLLQMERYNRLLGHWMPQALAKDGYALRNTLDIMARMEAVSGFAVTKVVQKNAAGEATGSAEVTGDQPAQVVFYIPDNGRDKLPITGAPTDGDAAPG